MKARLAHDHWSLVVDKPGSSSLADVQEGAFKSVGFQDALTRLEKVTGIEFPAKDREVLKSVAEHRNRVVHFYHHVLDGSDVTLRLEVAKDQCRAWALFRQLLEGPWQLAFPGIASSLDTLHDAFAMNRVYLEAQFERIAGRLRAAIASGGTVEDCSTCGFTSMLIELREFDVRDGTCLVCSAGMRAVQLTCQECQRVFETVPDKSVLGPCGHEIGLEEMCRQLGLDVRRTRNCWTCAPYSGLGSVYVAHDGNRLFCMTCMQAHSPRLQECRSCGANWAGCDDTYVVECPTCRS